MRHRPAHAPLLLAVLAAGLVVAACGASTQDPAAADAGAQTETSPPPLGAATYLPRDATVTASDDPITRDDQRPPSYAAGWHTDWGIRLVDLADLHPAGPPRDGIPAIDAPQFVSLPDALALYDGGTPVVRIDVNNDVRAYPLEILIWHEIVNDVVGGVPVAVTYCAQCNTAIAYDRRLGDATFEFGVTGLLRDADLVMYDRSTESLWQQIGGKAIVGAMVGAKLTPLLAPLVSLDQFRESSPDGLVLARPAGLSPPRPYGALPAAYLPYQTDDSPFLFASQPDSRFDPEQRVVAFELSGEHLAYPIDLLAGRRVVNGTRGRDAFVLFWTPSEQTTPDADDSADADDPGRTGVFLRRLDGALLTFASNPADPAGRTFVDDQTGSVWNIEGEALEGPHAGARLQSIAHGLPIWFTWSVYRPAVILIEPPDVAG